MTKTYIVSEEVLRQVVDALEYVIPPTANEAEQRHYAAIDKLRAILASPPSEPVAWTRKMYGGVISDVMKTREIEHAEKYARKGGETWLAAEGLKAYDIPLYRKDA